MSGVESIPVGDRAFRRAAQLAWMAEESLSIAIGFASAVVTALARAFESVRPKPLVMFWIGWIVLVFYLAFGWSGTGRTLGKQLLGLRVVDHHGERLRFGVAFLRALFCGVFPFTLFWCAISSANRDVADIILRTSVVYDWRIRVLPVGRVQVPTA